MGDRFVKKVAVVTGCAQGMGRAIATRFAQEGARVALLDIKREKIERLKEELEEISPHVMAIETDISDEVSVKTAFASILSTFGRVDILVNNAGILYPTKIHDISLEEWDRVLDVNLKGVFLCSKEAYLYMKGHGGGVIVNNSSSAGKRTSTLGGLHYTTSKAGVLGLTRHFAREAGPFGIRVNAICPGIINTEMVQENTTLEHRKIIAERLPLQRIGEPSEVADLVAYLASDESSYITGAAINIGGGELVL